MLTRSRADAKVAFAHMQLVHPRAEQLWDLLDEMRDVKRRSPAGAAQQLGLLIAESQAGKSEALKMYMKKRVVQYCREKGLFPEGANDNDILKRQRVVLFISLSARSSLSKLTIDMLSQGFQDPLAASGRNPFEKLFRITSLLATHDTELIIFDEIGNLQKWLSSGTASGYQTTSVQDHFRDQIIMGYPIFFSGVPKSEHKILSDPQLDRRDVEWAEFGPLSLTNEEHRRIFNNFLYDMTEHLKAWGVCDSIIDFESDMPPRLMLACGGYLGVATRVVSRAIVKAVTESADHLTRDHFRRVTAEYCIKHKFCTFNPFDAATLSDRLAA